MQHTYMRSLARIISGSIHCSNRPLLSRVHCRGRLIVHRKPDGEPCALHCAPSLGRCPSLFYGTHCVRSGCPPSVLVHYILYIHRITRTAANKRLWRFSISDFLKSRRRFHVLLGLPCVCFIGEIIQTLKIRNFRCFVQVCLLITALNIKRYVENSGDNIMNKNWN